MTDLQRIVDSNGNMKELANMSMVQEQNKIFKNQVMTMHRQINQKDAELEKMQTRIAQFEKRMVLI